jgi:hypothetical protein
MKLKNIGKMEEGFDRTSATGIATHLCETLKPPKPIPPRGMGLAAFVSREQLT